MKPIRLPYGVKACPGADCSMQHPDPDCECGCHTTTDEGFCTHCGEQIPSFEGLHGCPRCGTGGVPCSFDRQVTVSVNEHELRILCMWAENYARSLPGPRSTVVPAIAQRLRVQLPLRKGKRTPLTMAHEIDELRAAGFDARLENAGKRVEEDGL